LCKQTKSLTINPKVEAIRQKKASSSKQRIAKWGTAEKICGCGGFFLFRYVENTRVYALLEERFGFLKSSGKGLSLYQSTKQLLAHFVEGTGLSMTAFDRRQQR